MCKNSKTYKVVLVDPWWDFSFSIPKEIWLRSTEAAGADEEDWCESSSSGFWILTFWEADNSFIYNNLAPRSSWKKLGKEKYISYEIQNFVNLSFSLSSSIQVFWKKFFFNMFINFFLGLNKLFIFNIFTHLFLQDNRNPQIESPRDLCVLVAFNSKNFFEEILWESVFVKAGLMVGFFRRLELRQRFRCPYLD